MCKKIKLTRGRVALVDNADFDYIGQYKWHAHITGGLWYATRTIRIQGKRKSLSMHRLILNAPGGLSVDHINGNGLDNRRENLRLCTHTQNLQNRHSVSGVSKYKGVSKFRNGWQAHITIDGKLKRLGVFKSEREAANAYDINAKKLFGGFAKTNEEIYREVR